MEATFLSHKVNSGVSATRADYLEYAAYWKNDVTKPKNAEYVWQQITSKPLDFSHDHILLPKWAHWTPQFYNNLLKIQQTGLSKLIHLSAGVFTGTDNPYKLGTLS